MVLMALARRCALSFAKVISIGLFIRSHARFKIEAEKAKASPDSN